MNTFTLLLQDAKRSESIDAVASFAGEDASGGFGILAGHARMLTTLVTGLARYRHAGGEWQYLAMPGAVLYFCDNTLTLSTRRYLRDSDYQRISRALREQLLAEEDKLRVTRDSLRRMEESLLKQLWEVGRQGG
jgi:F-type H+-transporting ATPase subunit epsilon